MQEGVSEHKAEVAGYWKTAGPLTQVVLRGSGHMVRAHHPQHHPYAGLEPAVCYGMRSLLNPWHIDRASCN